MRSAGWKRLRTWVGVLFFAVLAGCGARVNEPRLGAYRATLALPGGDAPFRLEVAREDGRFVLYLVNATERTRVDNVQLVERELRAVFPGYENTLRARMYRDRLEGDVTLIKAGGKGFNQAVAIGAIGIMVHLHIHNFVDNLYVQGMYLHLAIIQFDYRFDVQGTTITGLEQLGFAVLCLLIHRLRGGAKLAGADGLNHQLVGRGDLSAMTRSRGQREQESRHEPHLIELTARRAAAAGPPACKKTRRCQKGAVVCLLR